MTQNPTSSRRKLAVASRWALPSFLFIATAATTTAFGFSAALSFSCRAPLFTFFFGSVPRQIPPHDLSRWTGLWYSVPVLAILLAHELGHSVVARRHRVAVTLPYFGPFPNLFGTLGAMVLFRSAIVNRKSLFAISATGPIVGFVLLLPILTAGVWQSRVVRGAQISGPIGLGIPPLMQWLEHLRFPGVSYDDVLLHPLALAAWVGLLATAINLIPAGQLDGGHILYALFGESVHRWATFAVIALMVLLGFFYHPWWLGAMALFVLRRHPLIYDEQPLDRLRVAIGLACLAILAVSICLVPIQLR